MKKKAFLFGSIGLLAIGMGTAIAGPCTGEIDNLTKTLASKDAGSGPTTGTGTATPHSTGAGQHAPTTAMSQATGGGAASPEDVRRQTAGQPPAAQQKTTGSEGQHPPTAAMTEATQGQAARSTEGHPPTAAMSQATQGQAAPATSAGDPNDATALLARARAADAQGQEAQCMEAVQQTKRLLGSR
jgi:hypothetical protein